MSSEDKDYDDLTVIKSVGEARQTFFRDAFNVKTYQDLATLSPDEIAPRLRGVSPDMVGQWLTQAKELAAQASQQPMKLPHLNEDEWEWLKAFVVEFCVLKSARQVQKQEIRVYPLKISEKGDWLDNGGSKKTPIIFSKGETLYAWMAEQLDGQIWQEPVPDSVTPMSSQISPSRILQTTLHPIEALPSMEITQIRAYQPLSIDAPVGVGEAGQPFIGFVNGDTPFALEVAFAMSKNVADEIAREIGYKADFYARSMNANMRVSLGETMLDFLFSDKLTYTARLPKATLKPGLYRLGVQVKLRSHPPKVRHLEVPMFQVV